jgi:hypothetical protein
MANLTKVLVLFTLVFLTACGGGGGGGGKAGRSTGPSEAEIMRLNDGKTAAESAEKAYYEKKLERIQLEQQLEDK